MSVGVPFDSTGVGGAVGCRILCCRFIMSKVLPSELGSDCFFCSRQLSEGKLEAHSRFQRVPRWRLPTLSVAPRSNGMHFHCHDCHGISLTRGLSAVELRSFGLNFILLGCGISTEPWCRCGQSMLRSVLHLPGLPLI